MGSWLQKAGKYLPYLTESRAMALAESTTGALMVSGAAAVAESTDLTAAGSTELLLQATENTPAASTINSSFIAIPLYF
jgi:hypothetical protein